MVDKAISQPMFVFMKAELTEKTNDKIEELKSSLSPIFKKYNPTKVTLFGSFSNGTNSKRSDLDLLAICDTQLSFFERLEGILKEIQLAVPVWGVDLLIYTPEEIEKIKHRTFIRNILTSGIVIYEPSQN